MKKKILLLVVMLITSATAIIAQKNDNNVIVTEARTSKPYHFINIKGEMNVKIVQDEMPGISVEGTNYQLDNTITWLRNDTLFVYQTNVRKSDSKTRLMINVDNVVLLEVSGKTRVDCSGHVDSDILTIRAKEGAQIKLDVRALKVDSKVTGCSSVILSGNTADNVESKDKCSNIDSHLLDVADHKGNSSGFCSGC